MARYALIIGIAEYTTGSFQSLESPVQNANAIADILDRYGEFNQVMRLPFRREAGQKDLGKVIRKPLPNETLVQELQQFLQDAAGSEVLLYYSGHGFSKVQPLSGTSEGYLAPSDCRVELNAAGQIIAEKNGISLADLNKLIDHHSFSSLVVILDCCNSGAFLESDMIHRDFTFSYERDCYLITACRSNRKSYEGENHSLLTAAVLKGLSPASVTSGSDWISGDRLFDVIGNELRNSRQEPIRMGWGRLITLVRYPQQPDLEPVVHPFNAANPYMGLKPFGQEQAAYFFGREQAVRALLDRLADHRFLAVIGPSGCGKSSLVKAGLLPELKGDRIPGSHTWQVESITPGQYSLQALSNAMERHHADNQPVVLFVDQFEELFTLCSNEEEQRTFIKRLNEETNDPTKQTRIIVAMRGDFLDRCAKFQEAADLINSTAPTTYIVTPLTEAKLVGDLEASIVCPAALHGVSFEPGLVPRIVDDVINQPGAMPLLQYALLQLWDNCLAADDGSRLLTMQSYDAIDGVKGALQRWADQFYTNLSPADQAFVRELISELVQIGDGDEVTRRRASWERLRSIASQDQLDRIIGRLVYQRLLVADDKTVEVAHEALLSESKLIQGWIEENREGIRLQQRLEIYCREWQDHDRSENYLLDSGRLAAIDEWIEKKQPRLMPIDQEFIEKSRERRDRQFQAQLDQERQLREEAEGRELAEIEKKIEAEARAEAEYDRAKESEARVKAERRRKQFAIAAGMLMALTLGLGALAHTQRQQVRSEQMYAIGSLIEKAKQRLESHDELEAMITGVEALAKVKETEGVPENEIQKIRTVLSHVREISKIQVHQGKVTSLAISSDGKLVVSGGIDKKIRIWNTEQNSLLPLIPAHDNLIRGMRFSPDNQFFASTSVDKTVKIWTRQGKLINQFNYGDYVYDVDFSSDGQEIAASGNERGIIIWSLKTLAITKIIREKSESGKAYKFYKLDFHPLKKSILASTGIKGFDLILFDLSQKNSNAKYIGKDVLETGTVRFNYDGKMIASHDELDGISIRSLSGDLLAKIRTSGDSLRYVEFNFDDSKLASLDKGGNVEIWNVNEALVKWRSNQEIMTQPIQTIQVGNGSISQIAFMFNSRLLSPRSSDEVLISADTSGFIRLWAISEGKESGGDENTESVLTKSCGFLEGYAKINSDFRKRYLTDCRSQLQK